jgi:hypothetical protein
LNLNLKSLIRELNFYYRSVPKFVDRYSGSHSKLKFSQLFPVIFQLWYETAKHDLRLGQKLCLDSGEKYPHLSKCHEMGGTQDWKHSGSVSIFDN